MSAWRATIPDFASIARRAVRSEIAHEAMRLFARDGFDETTVASIAEVAGVSPRTFFRYFGSKDEVLVAGLDQIGRDIAAAAADRSPSEAPWTVMRRSLDGLICEAEQQAAARVAYSTVPSLLSQAKRADWQQHISGVLRERLPSSMPARDLVADAIAAAGLVCFEAAQTHWYRADRKPGLAEVTDRAMDAVRPLPPPPIG